MVTLTTTLRTIPSTTATPAAASKTLTIWKTCQVRVRRQAGLTVLYKILNLIFQMITLIMESMEISSTLTMERILQLKNLNSTSLHLSLR